MDYFYSKAKKRFYSTADKRRPKDVVQVEPIRGQQFYAVQAKGDAAVARGEPRDGFVVHPDAIKAAISDLLPDPAHATEARRLRRNQLLAESDHLFVADRDLPGERLAPWRAYRQQLRDLDLTEEVDWPTTPEN